MILAKQMKIVGSSWVGLFALLGWYNYRVNYNNKSVDADADESEQLIPHTDGYLARYFDELTGATPSPKRRKLASVWTSTVKVSHKSETQRILFNPVTRTVDGSLARRLGHLTTRQKLLQDKGMATKWVDKYFISDVVNEESGMPLNWEEVEEGDKLTSLLPKLPLDVKKPGDGELANADDSSQDLLTTTAPLGA